MTLQFKNIHIFFALEAIWNELDYRFRYHINQLVSANSEDDFVQSVSIDERTLLLIYQNVSSKPEGVAAQINKEMFELLQPQILQQSNITDVQQGAEPNEASRVLLGIQAINEANQANKEAKILNGKTQILA